jgi:hypothetical protein
MKIHREELNINGFTKLGKVISKTDLPIFLKKLYELTQQQIEKYGKDFLIERNELESIRDLAQRDKIFVDLICNERLNNFIDITLNNRAVIKKIF